MRGNKKTKGMVIRGHNRNVNEGSLGKRGEGDDPIPCITLCLASTPAQGRRTLSRDGHVGQGVSTEAAEREMRAEGADKSKPALKEREGTKSPLSNKLKY